VLRSFKMGDPSLSAKSAPCLVKKTVKTGFAISTKVRIAWGSVSTEFIVLRSAGSVCLEYVLFDGPLRRSFVNLGDHTSCLGRQVGNRVQDVAL